MLLKKQDFKDFDSWYFRSEAANIFWAPDREV